MKKKIISGIAMLVLSTLITFASNKENKREIIVQQNGFLTGNIVISDLSNPTVLLVGNILKIYFPKQVENYSIIVTDTFGKEIFEDNITTLSDLSIFEILLDMPLQSFSQSSSGNSSGDSSGDSSGNSSGRINAVYHYQNGILIAIP